MVDSSGVYANQKKVNMRVAVNNGKSVLTPSQSTLERKLTFTYAFIYKSRPIAIVNNVATLAALKVTGTSKYKHNIPNYCKVIRFQNEEASIKYFARYPAQLAHIKLNGKVI